MEIFPLSSGVGLKISILHGFHSSEIEIGMLGAWHGSFNSSKLMIWLLLHRLMTSLSVVGMQASIGSHGPFSSGVLFLSSACHPKGQQKAVKRLWLQKRWCHHRPPPWSQASFVFAALGTPQLSMESLFWGFFSLPCRANKETNIIEYHEVNHSWFANSLLVHEVNGLASTII